MKRTKILSVIIAVVMIISVLPVTSFSFGRTYYVDSVYGNDENSGTILTPFKSIDRLNEIEFNKGDRILFKAGETFVGQFTPKTSGTENEPIVVSSYGEGDKPIISNDKTDGVFRFVNVDYWTVDGLSFKAPDGGGVVIAAIGEKEQADNITVENCYFSEIGINADSTSAAAVSIEADGFRAKVNNVHLNNNVIENVLWGIHSVGESRERSSSVYESPELTYGQGWLFENLYIKDAMKGGIVIGSAYNCNIRYCKVENCATLNDSAHAPLWMHHCDNVTVEYCEVSGSTNKQDGMTVDFDGWTTNSTYDHIYSHDNNRFIKNCVFDSETKNNGNKVTSCVSVNDGNAVNMSAVTLISTRKISFSFMYGFVFENNTIVDGTPIIWLATPDAVSKDNTFVGSTFNTLLHKIFNMFTNSDDVYKSSDDKLNDKISEITDKITITK